MPPKNMISVARNSHMPREAASRCCSASTKWCSSSGRCCSTATGLSLNGHLRRSRNLFVVVSFPSYFRRFIEIESGWRRRSFPFQARRSPRVIFCDFPVTHGPQEINHGQNVSDGQNGRTRGREHIQHLEFRWILPVSARHSHVSENELRKEREVETDKHEQGGQPAPSFRIHAPGDFRPPKMHPTEIPHDRTADHDVVEV